ncbi:MAG TPA: hypothetical protein VLV50_16660 [Stellaceae bacterium]|nr:hypothetical protein [Stellaceae bacterium]
MIRPSTILWGCAVVAVGYAMFQMKYEVMQQEDRLARLNHDIASDREAVRVLNAEWNYLSQPARLDELAKRYLTLVPIGPKQLIDIAAIPLRVPEGTAGASAASSPAPARMADLKTSAER